MPQLPRISPIGIPVHVIQRGNNRQACFVSEEDHGAYAGWLKEYSQKYSVEIHAWVMIMFTSSVLPRQDGGISRMMQSLCRRYVQYFNFAYIRFMYAAPGIPLFGRKPTGSAKALSWAFYASRRGPIIGRDTNQHPQGVWHLGTIDLKKSWQHWPEDALNQKSEGDLWGADEVTTFSQ